jgi:hypothetical protein
LPSATSAGSPFDQASTSAAWQVSTVSPLQAGARIERLVAADVGT